MAKLNVGNEFTENMMPVDEYIDFLGKDKDARDKLAEKSNKEIQDEYDALTSSGKIQCTDTPSKDTMIDRILSVQYGFEYYPVEISSKMLATMEKDWTYSTAHDQEVFRALCLDPATGKVELTPDSTRVIGKKGTGSVEPDFALCDKSFPGAGMTFVGSFHTHPGFNDKPLESLADVMVFASTGKEAYACTGTRWGITCMFRKKEPANVYDVPRVKKDGDKFVPDLKDGKFDFVVKSDVVDWDRERSIASAEHTNEVLVSSFGRGTFGELGRLPWFTPDGKESTSIGTVEEPFPFGVGAAKPAKVTDLYCETFYDWFQGQTGKVRTVCNNGMYAEAPSNPIIWMFEQRGHPNAMSSNFYYDVYLAEGALTKQLIERDENGMFAGKSQFWDAIKPNERGFYETNKEAYGKRFGLGVDSNVIKAASISIKGDAECEYLLETKDGKPRAIFCRKSVPKASEQACVMM